MKTVAAGNTPSLLAFPMHGQSKLLREGYRTRDGHLIEWFGRLVPRNTTVGVVSRPEPKLLGGQRSVGSPAPGTVDLGKSTWAIPTSPSRRAWWVTSSHHYPSIQHIPTDVPATVWNPFVALSPHEANPFSQGRRVVLDLLDDWTSHFAFAKIRPQVENAYRAAFSKATSVTANGEGTLQLARRFGREDAVLMPNGCDPERFSQTSRARGRTTVGYVGKIGNRVDLDLVIDTAKALPEFHFVFAGPILDPEYRKPLVSVENIELLGDVHYEEVPSLLQSFDVGWVPHRVGEGEVGGDVIKTYEYRAAGLPTLTTPVSGAGQRGLDGVTVLPADGHVAFLRSLTAAGPRVEREPAAMPVEVTWKSKALKVLELAGLA